MNILVLGSSGQIGSYLVDYLTRQGHRVREFDIERSQQEDLRLANSELHSVLKTTDFVFFLAFDVGGSRYLSKYEHTTDFIDNNMAIMLNTFRALELYRVPFVFASSQMSNMSFSTYGILKAIGERYTAALGGLTVKFWNVYGVEHDPEKYHVITDFIIKAKSGQIDMMTNGLESRQFLYAEDCCAGLEAVRLNYHTLDRSKDLCITSFKDTSIIYIASYIANKLGATIVAGPGRDEVQHDQKNVADPYILDFWQPETYILDGIDRVMRGMVSRND